MQLFVCEIVDDVDSISENIFFNEKSKSNTVRGTVGTCIRLAN